MRDVELLRGLWDGGDAPWRVWDDRSRDRRHDRGRRRDDAVPLLDGPRARERRSAARADAARRLVLEAALAAGTLPHRQLALDRRHPRRALRRRCPEAGDRFLLSKGHAASALYAMLAGAGVLEPDEVVAGYCRDGGRFAGHPSAACRASR